MQIDDGQRDLFALQPAARFAVTDGAVQHVTFVGQHVFVDVAPARIVFDDQEVRRFDDGGRADLPHEIDEHVAPERGLGHEVEHVAAVA